MVQDDDIRFQDISNNVVKKYKVATYLTFRFRQSFTRNDNCIAVDRKQKRFLTDQCFPARACGWLHFVILHHSIAIELVTVAVTPSEHISALLLAMNQDENQECAEREESSRSG